MTELQVQSDAGLARAKGEKLRLNSKWIKWTGVTLLWSSLALGSFFIAYKYIGGIQHQLADIQQANQTNINSLNSKLEALQSGISEQKQQAAALSEQFRAVEKDLAMVKEEMSLAGNTLNSSAATKQALSERITALSKELEELRKLIKKLEEAARAY